MLWRGHHRSSRRGSHRHRRHRISGLGGTTTEVDAQGVTIEVVTTVPDLATCVERSTSLVRVIARDAADDSVLAESRTLLFLPGTSP